MLHNVKNASLTASSCNQNSTTTFQKSFKLRQKALRSAENLLTQAISNNDDLLEFSSFTDGAGRSKRKRSSQAPTVRSSKKSATIPGFHFCALFEDKPRKEVAAIQHVKCKFSGGSNCFTIKTKYYLHRI